MTASPFTELDGRFRVDNQIAAGGLGCVYKGWHKVLDKPVAIKILHDHLSDNESTRKRFMQEVRVVTALSHPNIVQVYAIGCCETAQPYLVLEFVDGQDLSSYVQSNGALDASDALPLFIQLCEAIAHAHEKGIIHRDLKPSNILVYRNSDGRLTPKLIDFGIAQIIENEEHQKLTGTGNVVGSPSYMSPEQCGGKPLDHRSDIYSLGCVMFECLSGRRMFDNAVALATMHQHVYEPPPELQVKASGTTNAPALREIVYKTLSKNPNERPSASEIKGMLEAIKQADEEHVRIPVRFTLNQKLGQWALLVVALILSAAVVVIQRLPQREPELTPLPVATANLSIDPNNFDAVIERVNDFQSGDHLAVVATIKKYLQTQDSNDQQKAELMRRLAQAYVAAGKNQEALTVAAEGLPVAIRANDRWSHAGFINVKALALENQGHFKEAQAMYEEALAMAKKNGWELTQPLYGLASFRSRRGNWKQALKTYQEAERLSLSGYEGEGMTLGEICAWLSEDAITNGDLQTAANYLDKGMKESESGHMTRGQERQLFHAKMRYYRHAANPNDTASYLQNLRQALIWGQRALTVDPSSPAAYYNDTANEMNEIRKIIDKVTATSGAR